ncbi:UNVERIFIED_CONTAM: hypothetical protein HHA_226680 [Hammondia hammondi]|eukprot:XP_008882039.1 hypothetical protein HHA_226680 [Hammondia hammondi]
MATLAASSAAGPPSSRLTSVHHYEGDSPPGGRAIYEKSELSAAFSPSGFADHSQTGILPQEVATMCEATHTPLAGTAAMHAPTYRHSRQVEKTESVASLLGGSPHGAVFLTPDGEDRRDERESRREKWQPQAHAQEVAQVHGRHDAAGAGGSRYTGRDREEAALYNDPAACASLYRRRQQAHHNLFDAPEGDDSSASITGSFRGKVARPELRTEDIQKGRLTREFEARRASDLSKTAATTEGWSSAHRSSLDWQPVDPLSDERCAPAGLRTGAGRQQGIPRIREEAGNRREDTPLQLECANKQWQTHAREDADTQTGHASGSSPGVRTLEPAAPVSRPARLSDLSLAREYCELDSVSRGAFSPSALSHFSQRLPTKEGGEAPSERSRSCSSCCICEELERGGSSPTSPSAFSVATSVASRLAFSPKRDERNTRVKQIEALRSTGSVLPVSDATSAAVQAAAVASLRGGRRQVLWGEEPDEQDSSSRLETQELPYPLCQMSRSRKRDGSSKAEETRSSQPARLLPQGIPWHSSAASVLSARSSHSQTHPLGFVASPRSPCSPSAFSVGGERVCREQTARERSLAHFQGTGDLFASETRDRHPPLPPRSRTTSAGQTAREEAERRRELQRENPWYTDMFARETPVSSRLGTSQGVWGEESSKGTPRAGISRGDTLDREAANRRRTQMLESRTAHERFVNAMQSSVLPSSYSPASSQHLERAEQARTSLLREKHQAHERRQRLQEAVESGDGRLFHSVTAEETNLPGSGAEKVRSAASQRASKVVELDLFGVREDMTEEKLRQICVEGLERASVGHAASGENAEEGNAARDMREDSDVPSRLHCVLKVSLARDLLTGQCKGTGRVTLRCHEGQSEEEEVARRLYSANIGVRLRQVTVDRPPQSSARSFASHR